MYRYTNNLENFNYLLLMYSSLFGKSKLIILSTLIAIILVSMLSGSTNTITTTSTTISKQEALAQTNDNSTFKLYENPTFGIRMQYPSDWEKVEPGQISHESSFNIIVGFVSPKENVSDTSLPAALSIGIHNLSSSSSYQNTTLDQYTDAHINAIRREQESVVESTTTTLSASSNNNTLAHKVVYVNSQGQEVMQVWTIKENEAYHITYAADVARYPDYLPLAQKIIDSFEIGRMSTQEVQQQPPTVESNNNITTINENNTAATTITTTATPSPCCPSDGYNIANAGPDQTVLEGTIITLNGSSSNNKSSNIGNTVNYLWRQTDGPSIILNDNNTAHATFVAPNYPNNTKYTFALQVFENQVNNNNQTGSAIDTVDIIVKDVNLEAMNRVLQQEDVNIIDQSDQDELQDEGTTGGDDEISDDSSGDGDDGDTEVSADDEGDDGDDGGDGDGGDGDGGDGDGGDEG
jgi:PsbP-like protein